MKEIKIQRLMNAQYHKNLDNLRVALKIPRVNTGKIFNFHGIVFDDVEKLHGIVDKNGFFQIYAGTEMGMVAYRGQTREYNPCLSSLYRNKNVDDRFLAICRNIAFCDVLEKHPYIQVSRKFRWDGHPLKIDIQGLAQHYGLATDQLDFTSNFDVASFFAACQWEQSSKKFVPVELSSVPGVMYRICSPMLFENMSPHNGQQAEDIFDYVGWQPLPRPEEQRASSLCLKNGQDLMSTRMVQRHYFGQNIEISHMIWLMFEEGRSLFPEDVAATMADEANILRKFTISQIKRAWAWLEVCTQDAFDMDKRQNIEARSGIEVVSKECLTWGGLGLEHNEHYWIDRMEKVLGRVYTRRVCYPKS